MATLTFKAIGGPGTKMHLGGDLLTLGDTAFPAQAIGSGTFPRSLAVAADVAVAK